MPQLPKFHWQVMEEKAREIADSGKTGDELYEEIRALAEDYGSERYQEGHSEGYDVGAQSARMDYE